MTSNKITKPNAGGPRQFQIPAPLAARVGQFCRWAAFTMRTVGPLLSALAVLVLAGCTHDPLGESSWNDHTVLPGGNSVASLNGLANSSASTRDERARAIFTLFAHHIRPVCSAAQFHAVLTDTNWMSDVNLYGVYALGGWVPVEMIGKDTVFCLHLFPIEMERQWSPWAIYFRLSGRMPDDPGRRKEEARAFLLGDTTLHGNPRLLEFALCFPSTSEYHGRLGRIERSGVRGIHVNEQE